MGTSSKCVAERAEIVVDVAYGPSVADSTGEIRALGHCELVNDVVVTIRVICHR
jgi:hypothetical protein